MKTRYTETTTFKDIPINRKFFFRYGTKNERGPCRKIRPRTYVFLNHPKKFTVGTLMVEVVKG